MWTFRIPPPRPQEDIEDDEIEAVMAQSAEPELTERNGLTLKEMRMCTQFLREPPTHEVATSSAQPEELCSICQEDLRSASTTCLQRVQRCGHLFHIECLHQWCENNHTCPNCKRNLRNDAETEENQLRMHSGEAENGNVAVSSSRPSDQEHRSHSSSMLEVDNPIFEALLNAHYNAPGLARQQLV
ncbi:unnamed protein product [Vitrella brassicaformis CCMP3155]|uniref:RING-type domain-containing protein n=1 Tax=Vitrella brassicaformis (strain CCMP3155) TaxID=1169540 RepID=A0A0G4ED37_VITBC|nr:unnamed protein product [Vitrella brassicaformis CCMP3155]|eukprot:CEL93471.1 unnamed protein product [Vitrella brassicaformis CCMP3155]